MRGPYPRCRRPELAAKPEAALTATVERSGNTGIVCAGGEVDASNVKTWRQVLASAVAAAGRPGSVIVNVSGLDFLAGCGFAALADAATHCRQRDVDLRLASSRPIVARVIAVTGLSSELPIYPTVQDALS